MIFKPKNITNPIPYVILIHGSDYQDRNTPYYHSLGYALASNGIGVLLYDKRGCGKSTGNWEQSSFADLADDAVAALQFLKNREDLGISKIGFLGTSQGGWISTIAANKTTDCSFVIMNVGPSVSLFEQDIHRVQYSMTDDGWEKAIVDSAVTYTKLYFKYIETNKDKDWKALEKYCNVIKSKEWAEYVNVPTGQSDEDIIWWRKNAFNPANYLSKIKCPVLSIFGEKDILVPPKENEAKMDSLLKLSGTQYKVVTIKGCAHDMLTYQGLNGANWDWPMVYWQWRRQPTEFIQTITEWIKE
jgi:pimeloyl-ACP methyl ester carboxylesterase